MPKNSGSARKQVAASDAAKKQSQQQAAKAELQQRQAAGKSKLTAYKLLTEDSGREKPLYPLVSRG